MIGFEKTTSKKDLIDKLKDLDEIVYGELDILGDKRFILLLTERKNPHAPYVLRGYTGGYITEGFRVFDSLKSAEIFSNGLAKKIRAMDRFM